MVVVVAINTVFLYHMELVLLLFYAVVDKILNVVIVVVVVVVDTIVKLLIQLLLMLLNAYILQPLKVHDQVGHDVITVAAFL